MSNFEKAFKKIVEENGNTREKKGMQRGIQRGIRKTIKGFLLQNVADEIIINATGISRKELEQLKLEIGK